MNGRKKKKKAWGLSKCGLPETLEECLHNTFLMGGQLFPQSILYPDGWLSATSKVFPYQGAHSFSVVSPILPLLPPAWTVKNPFSAEQLGIFGSLGISREKEQGTWSTGLFFKLFNFPVKPYKVIWFWCHQHTLLLSFYDPDEKYFYLTERNLPTQSFKTLW